MERQTDRQTDGQRQRLTESVYHMTGEKSVAAAWYCLSVILIFMVPEPVALIALSKSVTSH